MATKTFDKAKAVAYLTTNCDCWKGKDGATTLNGLSAEQVEKLQANAEKQKVLEVTANAFVAVAKASGAPANLTVNEMPAFIEKKIADKADPTEEEEEVAEDEIDPATGKPIPPAPPVPPTKNKKTYNADNSGGGKKMTPKEWLDAMPDEARTVWNTAVEVNNQVKGQLIGRLVANVQDAELKRRLVLNHAKKDIPTLRDEVAALPAATANEGQGQHVLPPIYFGSGDPSPKVVANTDKEDVLDILTFNEKDYKDMATYGKTRQTA